MRPGLAAALVLAALPAGVGAQESSAPAPPGRLVLAAGPRLHIRCAGTGTPTVVLLHGFLDYSFDWDLVFPHVAEYARVCAYDRAGQAWSEQGPDPRGLATLVREMDALLVNSGERAPFILVGASWGGMLARAYAMLHPTRVAGMVLVDASHEWQYLGINDTTLQPLRMSAGEWAAFWQPWDARRAAAPPEPAGQRVKIPVPAELPAPFDRLPEESRAWRRWALSEGLAFTGSDFDLRHIRDDFVFIDSLRARRAHPLGAVPLVVITARDEDYDLASILRDSVRAARRRAQADLTAQSSRSRHVQAPNSGHRIHLDEPDLVLDAIVSVLGQARQRGRQ